VSAPSSSPTRHASPALRSTAWPTTRLVVANSTPGRPLLRRRAVTSHGIGRRGPPPCRVAAGRWEIFFPLHDLCPSHPIAARAIPSLCVSHPVTGSRDSGQPPRPRQSTGEHKYLPPRPLRAASGLQPGRASRRPGRTRVHRAEHAGLHCCHSTHHITTEPSYHRCLASPVR
jgi:hypothetical protein